jgi:hypothetical protein
LIISEEKSDVELQGVELSRWFLVGKGSRDRVEGFFVCKVGSCVCVFVCRLRSDQKRGGRDPVLIGIDRTCLRGWQSQYVACPSHHRPLAMAKPQKAEI